MLLVEVNAPRRLTGDIRKLIVTASVVAVALLVILTTCVIAVTGALTKKQHNMMNNQPQPVQLRQTRLSYDSRKSRDSRISHDSKKTHSTTHSVDKAKSHDKTSYDFKQKNLTGFSMKAPSTISPSNMPFSYSPNLKCAYSSSNYKFGLDHPPYNWYAYWTQGLKQDEETSLTFCDENNAQITRSNAR